MGDFSKAARRAGASPPSLLQVFPVDFDTQGLESDSTLFTCSKEGGLAPAALFDRANNYALTEYWLIPKNAELPEFVEARRGSHLSGYELTHAGSLSNEDPAKVRSYNNEKLTTKSYEVALERTVRQLKADRSAVAVILVPYYRFSRTAELNRRISDTLKYLKGHGIAKHGVFVKRIYSGARIESPEYEPKYPDIIVVTEK